jgi:signal transduction histidine kinase
MTVRGSEIMPEPVSDKKARRDPKPPHRLFLSELRERSLWFVRLRWGVPPAILCAAGAGALLGFRFNAAAVVGIAAFILGYNLFFWRWPKWREPSAWQDLTRVQDYIYWQLGLDYGAILLLIHFTGGIHSPVLFFCVFHILFAASLLPRLSAYGFAAIAVGGVVIISLGEFGGWIPHYPVVLDSDPPATTSFLQLMLDLLSFAATLLITAFLATTIMRVFYRRGQQLADKSERLAAYNTRFNALFSLVKAIGSIRHLDRVLEIVTEDLARVMEIKAISVKLLSEDGAHLIYKGSFGLPSDFVKTRMVEVAKSPLNQRIIDGEPFVAGDLGRHEMFQFGEDLAAARIQSVLFVPLIVEERIIGVLGAYCVYPDRFSSDDVEFFRLAAGLVAIGIDNSRAYEAIEQFTAERSRFMLRVAHNLRAPLAAVLSMLELLRERHLGPLNEDQSEYLRRVDRRTRTMLDMINELLTLSTSRTVQEKPRKKALEIGWLAGRLQRTFQDEAIEHQIDFSVQAADRLPPVMGNADQIEQLLENLASNAIKYTPAGGRVDVAFSAASKNMIAITVKDTGIGIPEADMPRLFTEFFRAANAREKEELGTGLGLAIVKEIVEAHQGRITVDSRPGRGTMFLVWLPAAGGSEG